MAGSSTVSRRVSEIVGVALFGAALIWLVALATYDPSDPAWFFNTYDAAGDRAPANFIGRVGAFLSELSFQLVGYASYVIPAVLAVIGWQYFWCRAFDAIYTKMVGVAVLFSCLSSLLSLAFGTVGLAGRDFRAGGYVGEWLAAEFSTYLNRIGSIIVILTLLFLSVILVSQFSFGRLFASVMEAARDLFSRGLASFRAWRDERRRERQRREVIAKHARKASESAAKAEKERSPAAAALRVPDANPPRASVIAAGARPVAPRNGGGSSEIPAVPERPASSIRRERVAVLTPPLPLPAPEAMQKTPAERKKDGFTLPPLALLDASKIERKIDERELMDAARLLEEKCREFAVEGAVVQIHPGPVVTTFEFKPDAGVKYSKITSLADDLSLAMQAESVLIDRIPGKSTVGVQMPNQIREQISLRDLLESEAYRRSASKLTMAMGKTIHGEPFMSDLAGMPHLLIAGSTGTGKSVAINAMLTSILYRATPDDVRLILIDPKRLELGMYEDVPHLLTPVVVDPKQAANALRWAVREMEERYKTLAAEGVRNIEQYNRNVQYLLEEKGKKDADMPKPLPYVVVVIDELADLMMVASNEVEESIARLAQMARAVGIHLILATQRPSVDVITGLIKANLPARVSFRVSSRVDSRTILDTSGAEQLLGKGDLLFLPPASSRLIRLHGPYISEQESARLASFLRKQGRPVYDETITAEEKGEEALQFEKDDLYDEAARIVVSSGQASISYLQRRLRIGFSRAARLVDMMEAEGLVSAASGAKPREVLVDRGYFDEVDSQMR
ncbi:MAG: DNA translocase FtsK [Acidobacteria bacterium]|nr:DNA translocase FtsK [Acidobacteriota bacterium]